MMEKDEYIERLKDKLLEEVKEVIASKTSDENLEELADLLEVIHALGKESGLSIEQIEEKRISKKQERGGFENRIYNTYIEVNSNSIDYYHKKPSDYPEIVVV
ncbi:MAG: nucleoside triphosphate pyrophosphohydrolase [Wolbachia endosymbiont of Pissodes strobi]|nr:nucleoside triphosphate pyrophosphohydrolase [Wolbachia endosymbiont of Pissodes strobi]